MKISQYCQRQRCKHVQLKQFLACFRVARVCQRQLVFLVFLWWTSYLIRSDLSTLSKSCSCALALSINDSKTAIVPYRRLYSTPNLTLYYNLQKSQINRLYAGDSDSLLLHVKAPIFFHITHILRSLHGLKINKRINSSHSIGAYCA